MVLLFRELPYEPARARRSTVLPSGILPLHNVKPFLARPVLRYMKLKITVWRDIAGKRRRTSLPSAPPSARSCRVMPASWMGTFWNRRRRVIEPHGPATLMGLRTGIISRLPQNELGTFIKNRIRFVGVSDDYLTYDDDPRARPASII